MPPGQPSPPRPRGGPAAAILGGGQMGLRGWWWAARRLRVTSCGWWAAAAPGEVESGAAAGPLRRLPAGEPVVKMLNRRGGGLPSPRGGGGGRLRWPDGLRFSARSRGCGCHQPQAVRRRGAEPVLPTAQGLEEDRRSPHRRAGEMGD